MLGVFPFSLGVDCLFPNTIWMTMDLSLAFSLLVIHRTIIVCVCVWGGFFKEYNGTQGTKLDDEVSV